MKKGKGNVNLSWLYAKAKPSKYINCPYMYVCTITTIYSCQQCAQYVWELSKKLTGTLPRPHHCNAPH